jgi:hypothetical protein
MKNRKKKLGKQKKHTKKSTKALGRRAKQGKRLRTRRKRSTFKRKHNLPIDPRVAQALGIMRREGASASVAVARVRMKLRTFRKGAGRFLYRSGPGKPWKARSEDELQFSMKVLTRQGRIDVIVRNSRERRLHHDYENAVRMLRGGEDGAEEELKRFDGKTVGGQELITDPKILIELEEAGELDFENLYTSFRGQS